MWTPSIDDVIKTIKQFNHRETLKRGDVAMPQSPWGLAQTETHIAEGIVRISTASHGGYQLTGAAQARVKELFPTFRPWAGGGWYEEDCDWAVVALAHPQYFSDHALYGALRTIGHPDAGSRDYFAAVRDWLAGNDQDARDVRARGEQWAKAHVREYEIAGMGCPVKGHPRAWWVSLRRVCDDRHREAIFPDYPQQAVYTDAEIDALEIINKG